MNVAFVYLSDDASSLGGIQKLIHEISKRLIQDGNKVAVLTISDPSNVKERSFDFGGAKIYRFPIFRRFSGRTIYKGFGYISLLNIVRILKKEKFDIVNLMDTWVYHGYIAIISKILGLKVVSSIASSGGEFCSEKEREIIAKYSDVIIAGSKYNKRAFRESPDKIHVIYWGHNAIVKDSKNKENIVLSIGRVDTRKNYHTLIRTAKEVLKINNNVKFYVAGPVIYPDYMRYLKNLIDEYKLKDNVLFLGNVSDEELSELYSKSKIFYLPSTHEMFGIVFAEAMAHGLPVVSSNTTAIPEVVDNAGLLFNPKDYHAHAQAILKLLDDEPLYNSLSWNAFKRAKIFTWDDTYRNLLRIYKNIFK
jgi:glycosyltransferase involved in cell wall biosynthesis